MRRLFSAAIVVAMAGALSGGGLVLVEHDTEAGEILCVGARASNGKCDLVWLNYSVESRWSATRPEGNDDNFRDQDRVNCPAGSSTATECYRNYKHSKDTSPGWGTPATTALVPQQNPAPGVELGGVSYGVGDGGTGEGDADARVWTGLSVAGGGSGSVALGAGRNESGDPYACATFYGSDQTAGGAISDALNDLTISDDRSDLDSDVQFCGEFLRSEI